MPHAPAPWHAETAPCGTRVGLMSVPTGKGVCLLGIKESLNPDDVRLIEAAPELLEACEYLLGGHTVRALELAEAAVAKARGRA